MSLLKTFLASQLDDMLKNDVSLRCIGQTENLPNDVRKLLQDAVKRTLNNKSLTLNLALSYGGRQEIVRAARLLAAECIQGTMVPDDINEKLLGDHLYTAGQPDPDLVIRTGGESRLSNFLLWQTSYAEIYFTETLWPDFDRKDYEAALADFRSRQRRFGKTGDQVIGTEPKAKGSSA
jgi:undecaprenyl diphosphate synthase